MPCGGSAQAPGLGESRAGKPANSPVGAISRRHRPSKGGAVFYSAPHPGIIVGVVALPLAMAFAIASGARPEQLILRMGSVPFIDATGINALEEMVGDFKRHGASVLLVELRPNVRYKLERAGVIAQVGEEHTIDTLDNALQLAKRSRRAAAAKPPVDV
jgi:anti-anti-sigma regulatory factor